MAERTRQESREAFVLHSYAYRETSLLLDVFAQAFGRVSMVARAARSPRSPLRGVLLAFQPLALSWFGKGELRTLLRAEWIGGHPRLQGEALMCGFYLNELLLRLLPRDDPHEALFDGYGEALARLSCAGDASVVLRGFEKRLLAELGYAPVLDRDAASRPIDPAARYVYEPERGSMPLRNASPDQASVSGQTLLDVAADEYARPETRDEARALIAQRLHGQELHTRTVLKDLSEL